jgi:hypothetical protein
MICAFRHSAMCLLGRFVRAAPNVARDFKVAHVGANASKKAIREAIRQGVGHSVLNISVGYFLSYKTLVLLIEMN